MVVTKRVDSLRNCAEPSLVYMIMELPQQQGMGRVRWNSTFVLAVALLFLAMGGLPTQVQSVGGHGRYNFVETTGPLVNVTAKISQAWRTGFHFQPRRNWMNGPMYYKGYYHLFYQYDPFGALWGNITWGHAVSTDLIHWKHVDDAAIQGGPGWYDIYGAWSGSATMMEDGTPAMMYTGWSNVTAFPIQTQTQNLVLPVDASDPLLKYWYKYEGNPVIVAQSFQDPNKFRDPSQGWLGKDGNWRILLGGRTVEEGKAYVYKSPDFRNWTYVHELDSLNGTGMWECPDIYPISLEGKKGLPVSEMAGGKNGQPVKSIVKVSLENTGHDYYTLGTYDQSSDTFTADDLTLNVGVGLRYDYGKFYASKTFFDDTTSRRILFGWISERTSDQNAIITGWSGLQSIPRQIYLDPSTKKDLIQVPIDELDSLHTNNSDSAYNFNLSAGTVLPIAGVSGAQLDIQVEFYKPKAAEAELEFNGTDVAANSAAEMCTASGGAALRGFHGPFGLLVLADKELQELTAVYFYLSQSSSSTGSKWAALLCADHNRSSLQVGVDETMYGSYVRVLESDEYLTLRTLVDHSIVEAFAQGGRSTITSRVYPTVAIYNAAQAFLFNNGTTDIKVRSIKAWEMANIDIVQFP